VHVVADGGYVCSELRSLPAGVTLTGPLPRHACLYEVHPELDSPLLCRGRRGRPRSRGERIGTWAQLRAAEPGQEATLTRYGNKAPVTIRERRCLRPRAYRSVPVRVIIVTEPRKPGLARVTTDPGTPATQLITRYASRWAIEVAFSDAKTTTGAGEARNRVPHAVERTVPSPCSPSPS
jgi:hypothetical protein